ncbi:MAG: hypothetical protein AAGA99_26580 [Actinomycetota bacterium]
MIYNVDWSRRLDAADRLLLDGWLAEHAPPGGVLHVNLRQQLALAYSLDDEGKRYIGGDGQVATEWVRLSDEADRAFRQMLVLMSAESLGEQSGPPAPPPPAPPNDAQPSTP